MLQKISAHTQDGSPCCEYIGPDGSGQYVKMVHNGIEYGDIEIICEAYYLMKHVLKMENHEIGDVFEEWNNGRLNSYLIEITAKIMKVKDDRSDDDLVDRILDEAGQKGTGKWTVMEGTDMTVAIPTLAEAVYARYLSALKNERVAASKLFDEKPLVSADKEEFLRDLEEAVYASKIISYAQGFTLLEKASEINKWNLNFGNIALLWREGCIIRAKLLEKIKAAYSQGKVVNLIISDQFIDDIRKAVPSMRKVAAKAVEAGAYVPAIINSLQYFEGYTTKRLHANLLQAQRDWFGAHTFHRTDAPYEESFHHQWEQF